MRCMKIALDGLALGAAGVGALVHRGDWSGGARAGTMGRGAGAHGRPRGRECRGEGPHTHSRRRRFAAPRGSEQTDILCEVLVLVVCCKSVEGRERPTSAGDHASGRLRNTRGLAERFACSAVALWPGVGAQ
jgi:hypothetical protein